MERNCTNCTYKVCTRKECGENGSCPYQKFPHEVVYESFLKQYYERNPEWEGFR